MEEEQEKKGFKVEDRRRFSSEGELREERRDDPEPERPAASRPQDSRIETPGGTEARLSDHPGQAAAGEIEITFATFVVGLSTEALAALGEMPNPATGERSRDLRAAQQLIDIIGMLRDKTRGNLEKEEESLVDAILFDLRMKYVELAKTAAR
ncbi:MAG TPA: DUF1844 domain-containing protein [Candidatus Binataceae bacterium]|nr:DUF1844 domain-containing protein [Candidatus Binataceae bacterium]